MVTAGALLLGAGCRTVPPPPPPPAPPPEPVVEPVSYPYPDTAWTALPRVVLSDSSGSWAIEGLLTKLIVVGGDSASLRARCAICDDTVYRWVSREEVIYEVPPVDSTTTGSIAEFAFAVRQAAVTRNMEAIWPLLAPDFTFGALSTSGKDRAVMAWMSDNFSTLDVVPGMLDAGLTEMGTWWVAPAAYARAFDYRGPRIGFTRTREGRWEWAFFVEGEAGR